MTNSKFINSPSHRKADSRVTYVIGWFIIVAMGMAVGFAIRGEYLLGMLVLAGAVFSYLGISNNRRAR